MGSVRKYWKAFRAFLNGGRSRPTKDVRCSFCNRSRQETAFMFSDPAGNVICAECVALCRALILDQFPPGALSSKSKPDASVESKKRQNVPPLSCSFCKKTQREVKKLIAGPRVFICDECIQVAGEIIDKKLAEDIPD